MAFLFLFFTVALSLCVVGLIVIALAAILGRVRDNWKLKKPKQLQSRRFPPPWSASGSRAGTAVDR
jgi:hypothetical protein